MAIHHGTKGSYVYAIKRGKKFLQIVEPNNLYSHNACAPTMGARHDVSEYKSVWGDQPAFFERLTAANYLKTIMEEYRWGDVQALELRLIPKITGR